MSNDGKPSTYRKEKYVRTDNEEEKSKKMIIGWRDTVADPGTVMVRTGDTGATDGAMDRAKGPVLATRLAVLKRLRRNWVRAFWENREGQSLSLGNKANGGSLTFKGHSLLICRRFKATWIRLMQQSQGDHQENK